WYEPSTNGSGLTFVQSAQVADLVFGTWYVYSADGGSRWYTIQNTAWRSQGSVLEGDLYETRAAGTSCPAPLESCPVPFSALAIIGRARFTLSDEHNGRIEALTALGSTLFASNITRIRF
ncbi:MAG TPA: hypothetical protein VFV17_05715, partial [Usitatibacteraceae bacterium]|nr:hypothetical protein [Usitatibacteraceae bacterium]